MPIIVILSPHTGGWRVNKMLRRNLPSNTPKPDPVETAFKNTADIHGADLRTGLPVHDVKVCLVNEGYN